MLNPLPRLDSRWSNVCEGAEKVSSRMNAVTFPGTLDALSSIRQYVKTAAEAAGLDHSAAYNLILAVDEIATNVIEHGYREAGLKGDISGGTLSFSEMLGSRDSYFC